MALGNHRTITEVILHSHALAVLFVLFLRIYLLTLMGSLKKMLMIRADFHLHIPMYFFPSLLLFSHCVQDAGEPAVSKENNISGQMPSSGLHSICCCRN